MATCRRWRRGHPPPRRRTRHLRPRRRDRLPDQSHADAAAATTRTRAACSERSRGRLHPCTIPVTGVHAGSGAPANLGQAATRDAREEPPPISSACVRPRESGTVLAPAFRVARKWADDSLTGDAPPLVTDRRPCPPAPASPAAAISWPPRL